MDWQALIEQHALPIAMLGAGVVILWRFIGKVLDLLFAAYRDRIDAIQHQRDDLSDQLRASEQRYHELVERFGAGRE